MTWHLDTATIESYRAMTLPPAMAASLEAHVVACADCRALITRSDDATRAARNWLAIADRADTSRRNVVERALTRVGLREHIARLLVLTPTFRTAWLGAVALVCALALVAATEGRVTPGDRGMFAFLVLAPLLPVVGVAAAFGTRTDPAHEITVAAPITAFDLLLVRAAAVLATSTPVLAMASLAMPDAGLAAVTWLLPSLGLTAATLAFARWVPIQVAAGGLSTLWLAAAVVTLRTDSATHLITNYPAFRPAGQIGFFVLALLAAASVVASRHSFDLRRTA